MVKISCENAQTIREKDGRGKGDAFLRESAR